MTQLAAIIEPEIKKAIQEYLSKSSAPEFAFSDFEIVDIMLDQELTSPSSVYYQTLIEHDMVEGCNYTNFACHCSEHGINVMFNGQASSIGSGPIMNVDIEYGHWTKEKATAWLNSINNARSFMGAEQ